MLAVESPVEADGTDRFAAYFRMKTIERVVGDDITPKSALGAS
jgi:hypothetical protein